MEKRQQETGTSECNLTYSKKNVVTPKKNGVTVFALNFWSKIVEISTALGTALIGILGTIICADILVRNLAGASLPLISEAGALIVVTLVALQLASTVRDGRLARTELFISVAENRFPIIANGLKLVFDLTGAMIFGLICWASIRIVEKDMASSEFIGVPGIATLPTWPFRVLILIGFMIVTIEFSLRAITKFKRWFIS